VCSSEQVANAVAALTEIAETSGTYRCLALLYLAYASSKVFSSIPFRERERERQREREGVRKRERERESGRV
jgi:hypothetical protein